MTDKIFNEDCLEGMKRIPDGAVDMVLCDLPFGSTDNPWDKRLPFESLWEHYNRVCKENAAIVLFSQMPFGAELIMSNKKMFRYEWVWHKALPVGFLNAKKMPLRLHENILVFYCKLPTYNPQWWYSKPYKRKRKPIDCNCYGDVVWDGKEYTESADGRRCPVDVIKFNNDANRGFNFKTRTVKTRLHPTEKPIDLLEYLIKTYTNEGETVLDNCIGSGSTAVACVNTNRHFIGFETEEKYFEIAQKRIAEAQKVDKGDVKV
ncbi:MAG: site-specific DNA-methyltransferase [Selenomonadaceae bacterium]|nr:site-specific DNA-methyltransferase [Selenomonadaceae bacterium]